MKRQDIFNAVIDAINAINTAQRYSYYDHEKESKELEKADTILRSILNDELGDWGDLSNPAIKRLWDNYTKQKEGLK